MGSDNLFHKRKARTTKEIARKGAKKSAYESILIVCEGKKTEPHYFKELIDELELNTANVQAITAPSTCPRRLVDFALEKAMEEEYDFVYCVFDKDNHAKYGEALQLLQGKKKLVAAHSVPCFEYWLILHFNLTTKAFYGSAKKTPGEEAVDELKKLIKKYSKGMSGVFPALKDRTQQAIDNAARVNASAEAAQTDNPSTHVAALVRVLLDIRKRMDES